MTTVTILRRLCIGLGVLAAIPLGAQSAPLVSGRVTDAVTGAAMGSVEVSLSDGTRTTTAPDGSFRLRALEPGRAILQARWVGYSMANRVLTLANGQALTVRLAMTPIPVVLIAERVTARTATPAPGTTRIDRADLDRLGARDLGEVLRGQPGVTLVARGGHGSPVAVSIRGSSTDQVLVLVDGTPLNNPITGEADLSLVDPGIVDHVEIVRGAQSSRYGGRALGGVILVTTRHPTTVAPQLNVGSGQWGERRLGTQVGVSAVTDSTVLAATAGIVLQQNRGNFVADIPPERGGGRTRRDNADARRVAVNAGTSLERHGQSLDVRAELSDVDRGMPGSIVQPSLTARQTQRRVGLTSTATRAIGIGADQHTPLSVRAALGVQRQRSTFIDKTPPFGAPYDQRQAVNSALTSFDATTTVRQLTLLAGVEARRLDVSGNALTDSTGRVVATGGLWAAASRSFHSGTNIASARDRDIGGDAGDWSVDVGSGVRADVGTLWRGAYLSPDVHATARHRRLRVGAAWRSAFSAPSLGDLFFQEGVQVRANPTLRPERVRGEWTASVDAEPFTLAGLRTTIAVSGFRGDVDDLILWSPDFRFVWSPNNFDVSRRGIETSLRVALPSNAAALTLTGTGVDVRYRGEVLRGQVIYRPRVTSAATLDLNQAGVDGQLGLQYTGARRTVVGSDINQLPAFTVVQARIARSITVARLDARVRMSVENLFDTRFAMLVDYPTPGRTLAFDVTVRPRTRRASRTPVSAPFAVPSPPREHQ